jgi:hypothetical protein
MCGLYSLSLLRSGNIVLLLYQSLRDTVKFTYVKIFTRFKFSKSFKDRVVLSEIARRKAFRVQITQKSDCRTRAIHRYKTGRNIYETSEEMFSCWD